MKQILNYKTLGLCLILIFGMSFITKTQTNNTKLKTQKSSHLFIQNPNQEPWTQYQFLMFYRKAVENCPKIAFIRKDKNNKNKDFLLMWFSSVSDKALRQIQIDAEAGIITIGGEIFLNDVNKRYCYFNEKSLGEDIYKLYAIIQYRDKLENEY